MNLEPKKRFQEGNFKKTWQDVVDSTQFQEAATAALVQMAMNNSAPPDMASAASYQWRMEGAKQFLGVLMSLVEPTTKPSPQASLQNLTH